MNRAIKYKGWVDLDDGNPCMIDVEMVDFEKGLVRGRTQNSEVHAYLEFVKLLRSTGINDKNGVEIYEGDIIKSHHFFDSNNNQRFLYHFVKWSEKYCGWFALNSTSMSESDGSQQLWVFMLNAIEPEVIGNLHENPELLEDK